MTPKARRLRNHLTHIAISVDELFAAAFYKSQIIYQRKSLLGWRPVVADAPPDDSQEDEKPFTESGPRFSNSPDVKIRETSETIIIEVELPDIDEESLYLEVSGDLLIIKAEKRARRQFESGKQPVVHRYVKLPVAAVPGNIQARLDGPLLRIKISKSFPETHDMDPM